MEFWTRRALLGSLSRYATGEAVEWIDLLHHIMQKVYLFSNSNKNTTRRTSDETFSSNHYSEAIRSHRSYQGSYLQVLIIVLQSKLR
ncbi:hypothetical protein E3N88_18219 [Mikania micrantha]|uniref:Uncharacterized protein n=1 Tax=Mikania micrantha TaxID=192012 RepID=A0A5N6NVV2_9ASTR|nr:hypothetical protein E3N88_18219 [Mikania micrantha]